MQTHLPCVFTCQTIFEKWFSILDKFSRIHDKKVAILGLSSLLLLPEQKKIKKKTCLRRCFANTPVSHPAHSRLLISVFVDQISCFFEKNNARAVSELPAVIKGGLGHVLSACSKLNTDVAVQRKKLEEEDDEDDDDDDDDDDWNEELSDEEDGNKERPIVDEDAYLKQLAAKVTN